MLTRWLAAIGFGLLVGFLGGITTRVATAQNYRIEISPDEPLQATASLQLKAPRPKPLQIRTRGAGWGLPAQVSEVCGDGRPLSQNEAGAWILPAGCVELQWKLRFEKSTDRPVVAAAQTNVHFEAGPWWLISEPCGLLRIDDSETEPGSLHIEAGQYASIGASPLESHVWRVPAKGEPPEFFAVGKVATRQHMESGFRITHVLDQPARIKATNLLEAHAAALRYLLQRFPEVEQLPARERHLLVIWIGIESEHGQLGGAAGRRSFVTNYVFGDSPDRRERAGSSLVVVAHEQFHQLMALCHSSASAWPTWAQESLAHYYGLKALANSGEPTSIVAWSWERFVDHDREPEAGLAELQRRFEAGDRSVYPRFYSQGATFWADVERELSRRTNGERSLDDDFASLLTEPFASDAELPAPFLQALREVMHGDLEALLDKHIGD